MPEQKLHSSRYAHKVSKGTVTLLPRNIRVCDKCKRRLDGKKGHGFVSANGRTLLCGGCLPGKRER